ncbi:hypothetical protein ACLB6G_02700 [Zhengella sp. ZM62]|uniref:hypothetical protein n=1 Tax=Zhengella sedimenti TaxID=3390035 RepID=UPI00397588DF
MAWLPHWRETGRRLAGGGGNSAYSFNNSYFYVRTDRFKRLILLATKESVEKKVARVYAKPGIPDALGKSGG